MAVPRFLPRIAADLAAWYCLPTLFLFCYVGVFHQPYSAIMPHVAVMALPFAALVFLRLLVARLIRQPSLRLAVSSALIFVFLGCLLVYYAFVLIGVRYWGGVVAWNVIPTFFAQAPDLIDALGVPRWAVSAALVILAAALLAACWCYLRRLEWTADLVGSAWLLAVCATAGFSILWLQVANATHAPWITAAEPLSMTLFPLAGTRDLEGHSVTAQNAQLLDDLEDRARAGYVPSAQRGKHNVILIVVDALRPDHMSLFGYERETTPYLDSVARSRSVRKLIAHAACGDTICGLLSLTGSKFPRNFSFRPFGIHEVLRRNGYRVHMLLAGDHTNFYALKSYYGPVDTWFDGNSTHTPSMNDDQLLIDRLASMPASDGTPTMFQFHLMSVHIMRKGDLHGKFQPAENYMLQASSDTGSVDARVESATNFYDNGVVTADRVINTLLGGLEQKGYLRDALVVITADHGESLGEHGLFRHANSVREELLKIPVVFISYGDEPERPLVSPALPLQVDIAPTILAELNIAQPASWSGRPLQDSSDRSIVYFEERAYAGLIDMRQSGTLWKYWVDRYRGGEYAFDLSVDPNEKDNLMETVPVALRGQWRRQILYEAPLRTAGTLGRTDSLTIPVTVGRGGRLSSVGDTMLGR